MRAAATPSVEQLRELSACLLDIHHASLEPEREAFIDCAFARYAKVIEHDAALWSGGRFGADPSLGPRTHYIHLHRLAVEDFLPIWHAQANVTARQQVATHMAAYAGTAQILHAATPGLESAFAALFGCRGIRHVVGMYVFDTEARLYNIMSVYRLRDVAFTEAERLLHELAVPHLVAAFRNHTLAKLAGPWTNPAAAAAATDPSGTLHHVNPEFVRRLKEEWPEWSGPDLPGALVPDGSVARRPADYVGSRIAVHMQPAGELYHMHVRRRLPLDDLSRRQIEIARGFADGLSHKEIARRANIAPATVRNHLSTIYRTLGIGSKAELATLLARHGHSPPVEHDSPHRASAA